MEFTKKAQDFKRGLPRFRHRLAGYCRKMFAVLICTSMVLGGFPSAFYEALAADGDGDYVYELDGTAIYEALDAAIAEGRTLDSELKFSGDHKAEYDELFNPDGTLYELEDLKFDRDLERDKEVGLRVFMRVEGDIELDEAYEVDGTEEVIFLLTNRTDEEVTVQINIDGYHTEVIEIPAAKDIPVEIDKDSAGGDSGEAVEASTEEVTAGATAGGGSAASGNGSTGTGSEDEEESSDEEADTEASSDEEGKEDSASDDDTDADSAENEDSSESSDKDSNEGSNTEASSDDSSENDASSDKPEKDDGKGSEGKDNSESKDSSNKEDKDSSSGKESSDGDKEDKGSSKDTESSKDKGSSGDKEDKDSSSERSFSGEKGSSERSTGGRSRGEKSDSGEKTASISVNKTQLLAAAIVDEPEEVDTVPQEEIPEEGIPEAEVIVEAALEDEAAAAETASPSDASPSDAWSMNGTSYEAVRLGNRGAVAYVTTTEEFGLDKMLPASTVLTYEGEDYIVTVSYGRDAGLPRGVELIASEYDKDSDTYLARLAEAAELNQWDDSVFDEKLVYDDEDDEEGHLESIADYIRLFDISLNKDGAEVEPDADVEVTISYLDCDEPIDMETGYTIIHFGDNKIEAIETETEYQDEDETQVITFSISSFSEVMVIEDNDYGIVTFAVSYDDFTWITPNLDISKAVNGVIKDQDDYFYLIGDKVNPVSSGTMLSMDRNNVFLESTGTGAGSLSLETFDFTTNKGADATYTLVLLDVSDKYTGSSSSGKILNTTFNTAVSGADGTTWNNVGSLRFKNAGTINGENVDVIVTFDSVKLYSSFASEYGAHYSSSSSNGISGLNDKKICIADITGTSGSNLWIGTNYTNESYEPGGTSENPSETSKPAKSQRYNADTYAYPCLEDVNLTVKVVKSGTTDDVVDKSFLQVASDIDIIHNGLTAHDQTSGTNENGWGFGYFAETFKTLDGFGGTYYIYETDTDYIWADPDQPVGVVWVQAAVDDNNMSGTDSYRSGGIYADTSGGSWQIGYSEGWCATKVEIYDYTSNDLEIKKVDYDDQANTLAGATFILYKDVTMGDQDYPNDATPDASGYVTVYYKEPKYDSSGNIVDAVWSTSREDAMELTTGSDGIYIVNSIAPCDYYHLEEVAAPDGYGMLDHVIDFTIETYGIVTMDKEDPDVKIDETGSMTITLLNHSGTRLPDTGGSGSEPFRTAGLLISGSALGLLYITLRRRRRWIES